MHEQVVSCYLFPLKRLFSDEIAIAITAGWKSGLLGTTFPSRARLLDALDGGERGAARRIQSKASELAL